jgi:hypothetical protein
MSKYPDQSCRNCGHARWKWSKRKYPDGRFRIIVQQPGRCTATDKGALAASRFERIDPRQPHVDCPAWVFHNDPEKALN